MGPLLRQRTDGLGREAVDVLLVCLDALEAAVDAIDATGAEEIVPEPLIERLKGLVRDRTPEQAAEREGSSDAPTDLETLAAGRRVVHVSAVLADDAQMPAVRAYMVISALGEMGELLSCSPAEDAVDSFAGTHIDLWLATDAEESALSATAATVPDVADAFAVLVGGEEAPVADPAVVAQAIADVDTPAAPQGGADSGVGKKKTAQTVRVEADRLDLLMHQMGELVVHPHAPRAARQPVRRGGAAAGRGGALPGGPGADRPGHAGAHGARRERLHALPAHGARHRDEARQADRPPGARRGHRARPHGRRGPRRPARAPRAQRRRPRPRGTRRAHRGRQAAHGRAGDLRRARRRRGRHPGPDDGHGIVPEKIGGSPSSAA